MGIGFRIREAREKLGLTQKELASKVGITPSAITNYENDTSHPKEVILYKLIEVLQVEPNYLFQDSVANNPLSKEAILNKTKNGPHLDEEAIELLEEMHKRPELRVMFKLGKNATKKDVEAVNELFKHLTGEEED